MEVHHQQSESNTMLNAFAPLMKHALHHGKNDAYCDKNVIKEVEYEKQTTFRAEQPSQEPSSYKEESSYYNEASEHEATKDFFAKKPGDGSPFKRRRA